MSEEWERVERARVEYQKAIFEWGHLESEIKRGDLLERLNGDVMDRLRVAEFLQSTEMWDSGAIESVWRELVAEALDGQEEVAAWCTQALVKLKHRSIRTQIAAEIHRLASQADPSSWWIFHNAYLLLYYLGCKESLFAFLERFKDEIGESEIDTHDLADFHNLPEEPSFHP